MCWQVRMWAAGKTYMAGAPGRQQERQAGGRSAGCDPRPEERPAWEGLRASAGQVRAPARRTRPPVRENTLRLLSSCKDRSDGMHMKRLVPYLAQCSSFKR